MEIIVYLIAGILSICALVAICKIPPALNKLNENAEIAMKLKHQRIYKVHITFGEDSRKLSATYYFDDADKAIAFKASYVPEFGEVLTSDISELVD